MSRTTSYTLEVGKKIPAAQWARKGKPESAAHVRVELDLDRALGLVQLITSHALDRRNRGELVSFTLLGELRTEADE